MRITNNMLSSNLLRNLSSAQERVNDLQNQLSSGLKINKPSDDPVGIENVLRIKSTISSVTQWKNNADEALSVMNTTDSALGEMTSIMQRIRELSLQAATDTMTSDGKKAIGMEVDQLKQQIQDMANLQVGNKYIFGGTRTNQPPLPQGTTTWLGNDQDICYQVGNNENLPISVNGQTLFTTPMTGGPGLLTVLSDLSDMLNEVGAGVGSTAEDISAKLADLDSNIDNMLALRADLGARTNRMTALSDHLDLTSINLTQNLSDIEDADPAKTIIEFQNQQNVYKAALSVGAQIIQPSLVDFIK